MKPLTMITASVLALAGAACSQEKAPSSGEATAADATAADIVPASATDDSSGGFNLMIPGDDASNDGSGYGGFNLTVPGEDDGVDALIPDRSEDSVLADVPTIETPAPVAPAEPAEPGAADDLIRIDPNP